MNSVRVGTEGNAEIGCESVNVDFRVKVDDYVAKLVMILCRISIVRTVFAFRLNFDEHLVLPHYFHDFTDVRSWFVQKLKLFPE